MVMEMMAVVGGFTNYEHHRRVMKNIDKFAPKLQEELRAKDAKWSKPFEPPALVYLTWHTFEAIRRTKPYDHPINHTDIKNYCDLMYIELAPYELQGVVFLDRMWYHYREKHKEKDT